MAKQNRKGNLAEISIQVPEGVLRWLKENAQTLAAWERTDLQTPKQNIEEWLFQEFKATLDAMNLDVKQIFEAYQIVEGGMDKN